GSAPCGSGLRSQARASRSGAWGGAGGGWVFSPDWPCVGARHFGHRDLRRFVHRGGGDLQGRELPRGIITTDTRGITPGRWSHPDQAMNLLRHRGGDRGGLSGSGNLPDVTSFVARRPNLPPHVLPAL